MPDNNTPIDVTTNAAVLDALRSSAMLATVNIGVWSGERTDSDALRKITEDAGAKGRVGRVIKYLMAGADVRLRDAKAAFHAITAEHRALTLPWSTDNDRQRGPRLLPTAQAMEFINRMAAAKKTADNALDDLIAHYDSDVAIAKANLASLADADYPTAEQVRSQFYVKITMDPLPAAVTFKNLPPGFSNALTTKLVARQETMLTGAQASMWWQVRTMLMDWQERFSDPDAKFRVTLLENGQELMKRLPGWNLAGDGRVDALLSAWHYAGADTITPEVLRKQPEVRAALAKDMQLLLDRLDQWGVAMVAAEENGGE